MGVTGVVECYGDGRSGGVDQSYARTYTRVFDVYTSRDEVGPVAIRLSGAIPVIGSKYHNGLDVSDPDYEFDNGSFANSIQMEPWDSPTAWKVTVQYGAFNTSEFGSNPTNWKVRVRFGGERTERVVVFDKAGNPILNSTGDRYGEPITVDDHITTMTIQRNELVSAFDLGLASLYSDTINDATWNGFAARKLKLGIIETSDEQYDTANDVWYYTVTYPIAISRDEWRKDILDQGYNELDAYGGPPKPIMNNGQPVSEPVLLDGAGHRLAGYASSPVTFQTYVFDEADWSGLGIDLSLRLGV